MPERPGKPRRFGIRTRILLPFVVLFMLFAGMAAEGFVQMWGQRVESRTEEHLQKDHVLIDGLLRDQERRVALHARFIADMIELSERYPGADTGQHILTYLLEHLRRERVEMHLYRHNVAAGQPHATLIRKGHWGITTTGLSVEPTDAGVELEIVGVSPIERAAGIDAVIVVVFRLDERYLDDLKNKIGADISLIRDGEVVVSTIRDSGHRRRIGALADAGVRRDIQDGRRSLVANVDFGGDPHKVSLFPLQVGFESEGLYALSRSVQDVLLARRQIRHDTLVAGLFMLLVAVALFSMVIRRVTRPIADLAHATRRIASGEVGRRVDVTTRDEVGELGASFNAMIQTIEDKQRELGILHREELARADRLATIGELASSIAHEIRNPLAGISGAIQVIQDSGPGDAQRVALLDDVRKEIHRMEQLTRDLLTYARPRTPALRPADLARIMDRAIYFMEADEGPSVTVARDYGGDVPDVSVDPDQIEQVFLNILINAKQAMPDGGEVTVRTAMVSHNGRHQVRVDIVDSGTGMTPEAREKALRPFFTTKHRGTGLGLAIAHRIVEAHRATIAIDSEPGKGTTFSLLFPA